MIENSPILHGYCGADNGVQELKDILE